MKVMAKIEHIVAMKVPNGEPAKITNEKIQGKISPAI